MNTSPMSSPQVLPAPQSEPPSFIPYTVLGEAERWLERHLLRESPLRLSEPRREAFVRWTPYAVLAGMPLYLFSVLISAGAAASLLRFSGSLAGCWWLAQTLTTAALTACSIPGLFRRTQQGWAFLTYATLFVAVRGALQLSLVGVAGCALVLWFDFQVKYRYSVGGV
jgi:hypothetical protein